MRSSSIRRVLAGARRQERGATAIEYALMATMIAIAILASVAIMGSKLEIAFSALATAV